MTHQVAGPFCSLLLADLGAEVIKIERPPLGDTARNWPYFGSSVFLALNRNKKSLTLDLAKESGREIFARLIRHTDVFLENMAPGVVAKLGADYSLVKKLKKDIIYCSISGYGKDNPYSNLPAWDPVIQALSGLMSVTGEKDRAPVRIGVSVVDMGAGFVAALGIVSSLLLRDRERKKNRKKRSIFLDISLFDSASVWMAFWAVYYSLYSKIPERNGSAWPAFVPYQVFPARDGYIFIGASNEDYWKKLCRALALDDLFRDERFATNELRIQHASELLPLIEKTTVEYSRNELVTRLRASEIPCSPLNNVRDLLEDVALKARGMIQWMTSGDGQEFLSVSSPLSKSGIVMKRDRPPPKLGGNSAEILRSLGYSKKKVKDILSQKG
jgi:crotonobetainyl-CoA:carnitine CoA-transferase CaiB-like acyl-CoA transferase